MQVNHEVAPNTVLDAAEAPAPELTGFRRPAVLPSITWVPEAFLTLRTSRS